MPAPRCSPALVCRLLLTLLRCLLPGGMADGLGSIAHYTLLLSDADAAELQPKTVVVSAADVVYVACSTHRVVRVTLDGSITPVAGTGVAGYSGDGGPALSAQLNFPYELALTASGDLLIADMTNSRVRKVAAASGLITTVAGNGVLGFAGDGGDARLAQLFLPNGVAVSGDGVLYIADTFNNRIRRVDPTTDIISTFAGTGFVGYSGDGGAASSARMNYPTSVAVHPITGDVLVADTNNNVVRNVALASGLITTVAGDGFAGYSGDGGPAAAAALLHPVSVAFSTDNNILIAEDNNLIRLVDVATGLILTLCGKISYGYVGEAVSSNGVAGIYFYTSSVAQDSSGRIFLVENVRTTFFIRMVTFSPPTPGVQSVPMSIESPVSGSPRPPDVRNVATAPETPPPPLLAPRHVPPSQVTEGVPLGTVKTTDVQKSPAGAIAGGIIGGVVAVSALSALVLWWPRAQRAARNVHHSLDTSLSGRNLPFVPLGMANVAMGGDSTVPPAALHHSFVHALAGTTAARQTSCEADARSMASADDGGRKISEEFGARAWFGPLFPSQYARGPGPSSVHSSGTPSSVTAASKVSSWASGVDSTHIAVGLGVRVMPTSDLEVALVMAGQQLSAALATPSMLPPEPKPDPLRRTPRMSLIAGLADSPKLVRRPLNRAGTVPDLLPLLPTKQPDATIELQALMTRRMTQSSLNTEDTHISSGTCLPASSHTKMNVEGIQWTQGDLVDQGGYGKVYIGHDCNGKLIAIKVQSLPIGIDNAAQNLLLHELAALQRLKHRNVVEYLGSAMDSEHLYIFMTYEPLSLAKLLRGGLVEQVVGRYTRQILLALEYIHGQGVTHRDVKAANVLVDAEGVVKLTDFGSSKVQQPGTNSANTNTYIQSIAGATPPSFAPCNDRPGTPHWMAPEMCMAAMGQGTCYSGKKADAWSVGVTVVEMLLGGHPWTKMEALQAIWQVATNVEALPRPKDASPIALDFIDRCLQRDTTKRATVAQLLAHPFVAAQDEFSFLQRPPCAAPLRRSLDNGTRQPQRPPRQALQALTEARSAAKPRRVSSFSPVLSLSSPGAERAAPGGPPPAL